MSFAGLLSPFAAMSPASGMAMRTPGFNPYELTEAEKQELLREGLLSAGLRILAANDGRSGAAAIGQGLLGGLETYQRGKAQRGAQKRETAELAQRDARLALQDAFQQAQMQREGQRFGMEQQRFEAQQRQMQQEQDRQAQMQQALQGAMLPSGGVDQQKFQQAIAQFSPQDYIRSQLAAQNDMRAQQMATAGREGERMSAADGMWTFRGGQWQPLFDSQGNRVFASSALAYDPQLAAELAAARGGGKLRGEAEAKSDVARFEGEANAEKILPLVPQIRDLVKRSTGSGIGRMSDETAALFGVSTEGAKAIAALKPLTSRILMSVPRFEGPQGVMDVEIYKQAAGQLDDSRVPVETRLAALETIEGLHRKYAKGQQQAPQPQQPAGQWRIVR